MKLSKINQGVIKSYNLGYRITDKGFLLNPQGVILKGHVRKYKYGCKYLQYGVVLNNKKYAVGFHKLIAFQKFGYKLFAKGIQVRHLDGNSLNNKPDNIAIGNASDNAMDRPRYLRKKLSDFARSHRKNLIRNWDEIDNDREKGLSFRDLNKKYGVSKSTLNNRYKSPT